jgi:phage regulator Rha-like protein
MEVDMFNKLFGPSLNLLILDMFIENPDEYMNIREIARMVDKNPGSISRTVPQLVEQELLEQVRVGKNIYAYHLNTNSELVKLLMEFHTKLQGLRNER